MKKLLISICVLFLALPAGISQTLTNNRYVLDPVSINPAFAGGRGALNLSTFYGRQWVGVDGSPTTMVFSADAPLAADKLGLGLMIINDRIGVTKENQFMTSYAYKIHMDNSVLAFGLGAGIVLTNTAYSDLIVIDQGDEIYLQDSKTFAVPNFSFGMHFSSGGFFAGFSIPKFLTYSFDFAKNKYVLDNDFSLYTYLLNTGYAFSAGEHLDILPSVLLRYSGYPSNSKFNYDINTNFCLYDKFWLGASYRSNKTVASLFQFQPNDQFRIAYTYNFELSQLGRYSMGSHEIMLRYQFSFKVNASNPLVF